MTLREETDAVIRNSRRMVALAVAGAVAIAPVISGCGAGQEPQSASPTRLTDAVNVSVPKDEPGAAQIDLRNMFLLGPQPGRPVAPGTSLALYGVMINQVKGRQDRLVSVTSPAFGGKAQIGGGIVLPPAAQDGTGSMVKLLGKASATPTPSAPGRTTPGQPGNTPSGQPGGTPSGQPGGTPSERPSGTATPEPTGSGATPNTTSTPTSGNTARPQQSSPPPAPAGEQPLVVLPGLNRELLAGATVPVRMQFEKAGAVEFQVPLVSRQGEYTTYPLPTPVGQTPGTPSSPQPSTGVEPSAGTEPGQPGSTASPTATPTTSESPAAAGH